MTNSSATTCQRFVQNAWKKDLCSNCFKAKEDHISAIDKKPAYNWKLYLQSSPKNGILKDSNKRSNEKLKTGNNVSFHSEESAVIGYGGDDFSSDDDSFEDYYDEVNVAENDHHSPTIITNEENDADRLELLKLTKSNTDFNSVPANLLADKSPSPPPSSSISPLSSTSKSYSNLKLGKPLVDANGQRQTLKVSVEPFKTYSLPSGGNTNSNNAPNNNTRDNGFDRNSGVSKNSLNNNGYNNIVDVNFRKIPKITVSVRDDGLAESLNTKSSHTSNAADSSCTTNVITTVTNSNTVATDTTNTTTVNRLNKRFKENDRNNNNNNKSDEDGTARRRQIVPPKNIDESVQELNNDVEIFERNKNFLSDNVIGNGADSKNENHHQLSSTSPPIFALSSSCYHRDSKSSPYTEKRVDSCSSTVSDKKYNSNSTVTSSSTTKFPNSDKRKRDDILDDLINTTNTNTTISAVLNKPSDESSNERITNFSKESSLVRCNKNDVKANIRNAKTKLEPLFRCSTLSVATSTTTTTSAGKLNVGFEKCLYTTSNNNNNNNNSGGSSSCKLTSSEERSKSPFVKLRRDYPKDNRRREKPNGLLNLPLISSLSTLNDFELELDRPGSRELVGEPDGKADSDDTSDPPSLLKVDSSLVEYSSTETDNFTLCLNPQRSFLHGFKPKVAAKPSALVQNGIANKTTAALSPSPTGNDQKSSRTLATSTPKRCLKQHTCESDVVSSDSTRSSTKRHAPPPPLSLAPYHPETEETSTPNTITGVVVASNVVIDETTCVVSSKRKEHFSNENKSSNGDIVLSTVDQTYEKINNNIENKDCSSAVSNDGNSESQQQKSSCNSRTPVQKPRVFLYEKYVKRNSEDYITARHPSKYRSSVDTGSIISTDEIKDGNADNLGNNVTGISERTSLSLSCDSVAISPMTDNHYFSSERGRRYNGAATKVRYTLRKILRLSKEDRPEVVEPSPSTTPKKKLEIIHPLDLNKSGVQVVRSTDCVRLNTEYLSKKLTLEEESKLDAPFATYNNVHLSANSGRPTKPPPPPRSQSLDFCSKPMRPPPPKTIQQIRRDCSNTELVVVNCATANTVDSDNTGINQNIDDASNSSTGAVADNTTKKVYENLGESRQSLIPVKPQRSSSIRDKAKLVVNDNLKITKSDKLLPQNNDPSEIETVPECDRNSTMLHNVFDNIEVENSQTPSMIYCSSETESDIYYHSIVPPSSKNESVLSGGTDSTTSGELTYWKNRAVLHNSLEDNYGAVVVANHEALSQLLEQVDHTMMISSSVKSLQSQHSDMRWKDFEVYESSRVNLIDCKFYNAKWKNSIPVIISVSFRHKRSVRSLPTWITLIPVVEFTDRISSKFFKDVHTEESTQAYITVWSEEKMESILSYSMDENVDIQKLTLVIVQLTYALKCLQACGIEEVSLDEFIICREQTDDHDNAIPRLCVLPSLTNSIPADHQGNQYKTLSLCKCTSFALTVLLPNHKLTKIMQQILSDERATSLSQAKVIVEYWLWGPGDVDLSSDKLITLQRWLDLERATLLHKLVCSRSLQLSTDQRYHLMFLVRTNARMLSEASDLFAAH